MLSVPPDIQGLYYASGMIVFPTRAGPVWYMMGSNGSWVNYYPPLDLITLGSVNDFSNLPGQFQLHAQVYQILANQGLRTPMTLLSSPYMLLVMLSSVIWSVLLLVWLIVALFRRTKNSPNPISVKSTRWLAIGAFLANLMLFVLVGMTIGGNPFEMLFGFSPHIRLIFALSALLIGLLALLLLLLVVRLIRRGAISRFDRSFALAISAVMLLSAFSTAMLAV